MKQQNVTQLDLKYLKSSEVPLTGSIFKRYLLWTKKKFFKNKEKQVIKYLLRINKG